MQKAHADIQGGIGFFLPLHQAFCLHRPGFYTAVRLAVLSWIDHADSPALPIFDRRVPVGIEQITLVENGVSNFFDLFHIHDCTSSLLSRKSFSTTFSQVGSPCTAL